MTLQEIKETIFNHIETAFDLAGDPDYTMDVNLFDYGYMDSMDAMGTIAWLEEEYNIEITQRDIILYPMNTVEEIAEVVYGKVK